MYQQRMFWDITLINLPWRYHLSESINNGVLPLWNPYMNYGFPQMGHNETWYPVSWLLSFLFKYDLGVLQFEYLFNLFMAGIGFYKLTSLFELKKPIRISGAIAYMLCGVFIAQASHLGYVTSGAWMPFVFYFLICLFREPNFRHGLTFVFFYFLLVTGGYPGNFIVITYVCMAIAIYFFVQHSRKKVKLNLKKLALILPSLLIIFLMIYGVVIQSAAELNPLITRGDLEYTNTGFGAMTGSNTIQSYASLVTPLATSVENEIWGTARMLNDSYFGLLPLLFAIFFLVKGKGSKYYKHGIVLVISAIFFLLVSIAVQVPLHQFLFNYFPLLDKFRFPSLYRIFFILPMIIVGLFGMQLLFKNENLQNGFKKWLIVSIVLISLLFIFSQTNHSFEMFVDFENVILNLPIEAMVFIDCFLAVLLLLVTLTLFHFKVKHAFLGLLILISVDLVIHTWIRTPIFVARNTDPSVVDDAIHKLPEGFPLIDQSIATRDAESQLENTPPLWTNKYSYHKYPIYSGSSPYSTKTYSEAIVNGDLEVLLNYPFISIFDDFKNQKVDTSFYQKVLTENIKCIAASPNKFEFEVKAAKNKYALFNHNKYPHWHFYENENKLEPIVVSTNFFAVKMKNESSRLRIVFEPELTIQLFYLSAVSFILLTIAISFLQLKHAFSAQSE